MLGQLSDQQREELEELLLAFDVDWTPAALQERVSELGGKDKEFRSAALVEFVKLDLEHRWKSGDEGTVEEYLRQFSELSGKAGVEADLLLAEYEARRASGSPVALEAYKKTVPTLLLTAVRTGAGTPLVRSFRGGGEHRHQPCCFSRRSGVLSASSRGMGLSLPNSIDA